MTYQHFLSLHYLHLFSQLSFLPTPTRFFPMKTVTGPDSHARPLAQEPLSANSASAIWLCLINNKRQQNAASANPRDVCQIWIKKHWLRKTAFHRALGLYTNSVQRKQACVSNASFRNKVLEKSSIFWRVTESVLTRLHPGCSFPVFLFVGKGTEYVTRSALQQNYFHPYNRRQ